MLSSSELPNPRPWFCSMSCPYELYSGYLHSFFTVRFPAHFLHCHMNGLLMTQVRLFYSLKIFSGSPCPKYLVQLLVVASRPSRVQPQPAFPASSPAVSVSRTPTTWYLVPFLPLCFRLAICGILFTSTQTHLSRWLSLSHTLGIRQSPLCLSLLFCSLFY